MSRSENIILNYLIWGICWRQYKNICYIHEWRFLFNKREKCIHYCKNLNTTFLGSVINMTGKRPTMYVVYSFNYLTFCSRKTTTAIVCQSANRTQGVHELPLLVICHPQQTESTRSSLPRHRGHQQHTCTYLQSLTLLGVCARLMHRLKSSVKRYNTLPTILSS